MPRILRRYSWEEQAKDSEYIRRQLEEDKLGEQLTMFGKDDDPFKGRK